MALIRDLAGNSVGITIPSQMNTMDLSTTDATVPIRTNFLRVGGAGNIILRPVGGGADITIAVTAGEYLPIDAGTVIRRTGTTATGIVGVG